MKIVNTATAETGMWEQTYDLDSELIVCKCNIRFNSELEHKQHNNEKHKKESTLSQKLAGL